MSTWQATDLHLIAMGVRWAQIHWSVLSVVDMYNVFPLLAFTESRAWRAYELSAPSQESDFFLRQLRYFIKSLR